ncbi:AMP-binding protein, partial [uncultured Gordonia sp.]
MAFTIADLIEHSVDLNPERVALETEGESHTYAELEARANALAHTLRDLGIKPGDAVGLYSRNTVEAVEAMVAIFKARAVMVNVNYRYVEGELEHIFTDSGMKVLIHERRYRDKVRNVLQNAPLIERRIVIEDGTDEAGELDPGESRFEDAIASSSTERDFEPRSEDDLYMLYTGGTTGKPKGVVWRQEDIWRVLGGGIDWHTSEPVTDEW